MGCSSSVAAPTPIDPNTNIETKQANDAIKADVVDAKDTQNGSNTVKSDVAAEMRAQIHANVNQKAKIESEAKKKEDGSTMRAQIQANVQARVNAGAEAPVQEEAPEPRSLQPEASAAVETSIEATPAAAGIEAVPQVAPQAEQAMGSATEVAPAAVQATESATEVAPAEDKS